MTSTFIASASREILILSVPFESIDAGNVVEFRELLKQELSPGARVILDLSECEFIDSAGLGAIVWGVRRLAEIHGEFRISGVQKPVQALFELVRMDKLVPVFEQTQEAVDSFRN